MISNKLLSHLNASVRFLQYPTRQDEPRNLKLRCRKAELAQTVLIQLLNIANTSKPKGRSAHGRRQSEATARTGMKAVCDELGVRVPEDASEAAEVAINILSDQKENLKVVSDFLHGSIRCS